MAIVQQTDGGLDNVAAMEMVRSGQIPDIAIDSEDWLWVFREEHPNDSEASDFQMKTFLQETKSKMQTLYSKHRKWT